MRDIFWLLSVAAGGAAGSVARALISLVWKTSFPWATFSANVAGAFLIGLFTAKLAGTPLDSDARWHALLVVGFCGGFTTFSTFSWQTLEQLHAGQFLCAAINILLSVSACLCFAWIGYRLGLTLK